MAEFSEMEQSIIKNSMLRKTHKQIADLLDSNVTDIAQFIQTLTTGTQIISKQMELDAHKKTKAPKPLSKHELIADQRKKDKQAEQMRKNDIEKDRHEQRRRSREPAFKTKQVDYSQMISVRIDRKTTIYAKPGEDISELKAKFIELHGTKITNN
jgi:hypothetical protein